MLLLVHLQRKTAYQQPEINDSSHDSRRDPDRRVATVILAPSPLAPDLVRGNEIILEDELHKASMHSGSLPGMDDPWFNPENYLIQLVRPVRRVLILPHVILP